MDFKDQIKQLGDRVAKMLPQIQTEEAVGFKPQRCLKLTVGLKSIKLH